MNYNIFFVLWFVNQFLICINFLCINFFILMLVNVRRNIAVTDADDYNQITRTIFLLLFLKTTKFDWLKNPKRLWIFFYSLKLIEKWKHLSILKIVSFLSLIKCFENFFFHSELLINLSNFYLHLHEITFILVKFKTLYLFFIFILKTYNFITLLFLIL